MGLKLEMGTAPLPVVVVDSVNEKPTPKPPAVAAELPAVKSEFEVVDVKHSGSIQADYRFRLMLQSLLGDYFGLKVHHEDQSVTVFALTGAGHKLVKADPESRTTLLLI